MSNLKEVRKFYKEGFNSDVDISLDVDSEAAHIEISIYNGSYYQTSVLCNVDKKDKKECYDLLIELYNKFDFSYLLEFNSIEEFNEFLEN